MLKCCLVQFKIEWEKPLVNLSKISQLLEQTDAGDALILLPEMFNSGFTTNVPGVAEPMDGPAVSWMQNTSARYKSIIAGSILIKENNKYYNRFICSFPNGDLKYYDKRHLFRMGHEDEFISSGKNRLVIEYNTARILPLICYDLRFPVWSRNKNDYDIILYSANWPVSRKIVWDILLKARAIENQSYVLGVNCVGTDKEGNEYSGSSQVIGYNGEIIKQAGENKEEIITVLLNMNKIKKYRKGFPVWKDADSFEIK